MTGQPAGAGELDLEDYAEELVAGWPPLTNEQRARLAVLLQDGHAAPVSTSPRTRP